MRRTQICRPGNAIVGKFLHAWARVTSCGLFHTFTSVPAVPAELVNLAMDCISAALPHNLRAEVRACVRQCAHLPACPLGQAVG